MPSIRDNNSAAILLASLCESDGLTLEQLALLIDAPLEQLSRCCDERSQLPLLVQVRLGQTIAQRVPRLAGKARRLTEQAMAARQMQLGATSVHLTAPPKWW